MSLARVCDSPAFRATRRSSVSKSAEEINEDLERINHSFNANECGSVFNSEAAADVSTYMSGCGTVTACLLAIRRQSPSRWDRFEGDRCQNLPNLQSFVLEELGSHSTR